jgi:phage protein D/phage baseplate assembly protein gpV
MTTADINAELSFVEVWVNGTSKLDMVRNNLLEVTVEQDLFLPDACTIRLADVEDQPTLSAEGYFTILDSDALAIGAELKIKMGSEDTPEEVFDGEITAIELEVSNDEYPVLVVRAYDRSYRMRRERKTKAFVNSTDGDIARTIAQASGLSAAVVATTIVHPHLFQDNLTDWEFLRSRAARIGYDMFVSGRTLKFQPMGTDSTTISAKLGDTLHRARVRMSAQNQVTQVAVHGWDPASKSPIVASANQATKPAQVGEQRSGAAMARSMGTGKYVLSGRVVDTQADAQNVAKAVYDAVAGDFLQVDGVCSGTPSLRPGRMINLTGIGRRLSGKYHLTAVTHRRRRGESYVSSFVVNGRRPSTLVGSISAGAIAPPAGHPSVVVGVVTDSKDPDTLGRVKIKFPWLDGTNPSSTGGVATTWARLASPMAGASRGLIWLPEVNDEVLVAFEHGDINRPFIVGGLWNGRDKPPQPAGGAALVNPSGKVERRLFQSAGGHTLLFDDSETSPAITVTTKSGHVLKMDDTTASPSVQVKTKAGHSIKLDDTPASPSITLVDKTTSNSIKINSLTNAVEVKCTGNMSLEATGNMTIKGTAINIEATASFTVKANGMGTVQAGGPLAVKGALVQIN